MIVLLLNPGFNTGDYYAELESTSFRRAQRNTVTQQLSNTEYKFFLLNPAFCWAPGFRWWEQKVRKIALKICDDRKISYRKALRLISSILAAIELVPYHSVSFGKGCRSLRTTVDELPSVKESIAKVKRLAKNPAVTIYVARQWKRWDAGLKGAEATVLSSNNARGVSFPVDSRIGKAILKAVKGLPA